MTDTPTPVDPQRQAQALADELADLFDWSDRSPLHALMHVRNAVLNERTDAALQRAPALAVEIDDFLAGLLERLPPHYRERAERRLAALGTPVLGERERERRCEKCGSVDIHVSYRRAGERLDQGIGTGRSYFEALANECLRHYCRTCGFRWTTPTLNTPQEDTDHA